MLRCYDSIPLGGHGRPFSSDSAAGCRVNTQRRVPVCCQNTGGGAAVLPAWGPSPLETRDSAGAE